MRSAAEPTVKPPVKTTVYGLDRGTRRSQRGMR